MTLMRLDHRTETVVYNIDLCRPVSLYGLMINKGLVSVQHYAPLSSLVVERIVHNYASAILCLQ